MRLSRLFACATITWTLVACGSAESDPITGGSDASDGSGGSASTGGAGGSSGSGATGGSGGPASGGNGGSAGGGSGAGGSAGSAGAAGMPGTACNGTHPLLDGGARFCAIGDCYCSNPDACFGEAIASACCVVAVTCEGSPNPVATIFHPSDGETRAAGSSIPFSGQASDPQDGVLTGSALLWTSDLTGNLGGGTSFNATLTAGTHRITLTATDSDSNTGTDSIELIVQ